jgi:hypothetical protein
MLKTCGGIAGLNHPRMATCRRKFWNALGDSSVQVRSQLGGDFNRTPSIIWCRVLDYARQRTAEF